MFLKITKRKFSIVFLRPSEGLRGPLRPSAISCIFYFIPSPQIVRRPRPKSNWFKFWLYISIKWYQDFINPLACLKENYYSWLWPGCKLALVEKRRSEGLSGPLRLSEDLRKHLVSEGLRGSLRPSESIFFEPSTKPLRARTERVR